MDTFYSKYIKYKSKYIELKGYNLDKTTTINTNDTYKSKYLKYKSKYINEIGLIGGVVGVEQCPDNFGRFDKSIFYYLRNTKCEHVDFLKIPPDDRRWTNFTWENFVRTNSERKHRDTVIKVKDLKDRFFPGFFLRERGFPLEELRNGGYTIAELRIKEGKSIKISVNKLLLAGYTIDDFKKDYNGWRQTNIEVRGTWFNIKEFLDANIEPIDIKKIGFSFGNFLHAYESCECTAIQVYDAKFDADDIYSTYRHLDNNNKNIIINLIKDLKSLGFSVDKLKNFQAELLIKAGFTRGDFKCSHNLDELTDIYYLFNNFFIRDLLNEGFTHEQILKYVELNKDKLIELKLNGFTVGEIYEKTFMDKIKVLKLLRYVGFSINDFICNGLINKLKDAGFPLRKLLDAKITLQELKDNNFTVRDFKCAGFTVEELIAMEFNIIEIKSAGFSTSALKSAGFVINALKGYKFSAEELKKAGFTVSELKGAGFSAKELKDARFTVSELKSSGFSAKEIYEEYGKDTSFHTHWSYHDCELYKDFINKQLVNDIFTIDDYKDAGFVPFYLMLVGFNESDLRCAGFTASEIYEGFEKFDEFGSGLNKNKLSKLSNLKNAGFSATELKVAGFSVDQLKEVGFSVIELKEAGYRLDNLISIRFSVGELSTGFSVDELKKKQGFV
jgi:intracellular multiplication protein IcmE